MPGCNEVVFRKFSQVEADKRALAILVVAGA